jgi:hypothetical protein
MDWILDLLTTCTHYSELQVITALLLISTIHRLPQHPLSFCAARCIFSSCSLAMASNIGDSSASWAHIVTVRRISHNWTLLFSANSTTAPSLRSHPCRVPLNCQPSAELPTTPTTFDCQSYCMTVGLPLFSSSRRQAPWDSRPQIFFQLNPCGHRPYVTSSLTRRWVCCLLWICLAFRQAYVSHILV